jgi:hypothetical protein
MEQNPISEASNCSDGEEIAHLLWNKLLFPVPSQMSPVYTLQPIYSEIHPYITLPYVPRSCKLSFPFRFPDQISIQPLNPVFFKVPQNIVGFLEK